MSGIDPDALDRFITNGRFQVEAFVVTCPDCEEQTRVTATSEYGGTEWEPAECSSCKRAFTGDEEWGIDEPPEPEPDWDEYGRLEPWS